jgi:CTP:molybdopterin cytidylyltransferase MocA
MGTPKALLRTETGEPWLTRAVRALRDGGCSEVAVVLGASFDKAAGLLPEEDLTVVRAEEWERGMGESLRAGLARLLETGTDAAVVTLVDLPDVDAAVVARVLAAWRGHPAGRGALLRATYEGRPGHPVVLGREHWPALLDSLAGDVGAQDYLTRVDVSRSVESVECADLATGHDLDRPPGRGA